MIKNIFVSLLKILIKPLKIIFLHPDIRYRFIFSDVFFPNADELMLRRAMEFASHNNLKGDYLEFGVWKGRSFIRAFNIWKHILKSSSNLGRMRFYAFDSFEGLPEIGGEKDGATDEFKKGQYACSEEEFKNNIKKGGVDLNRVTAIKGWYDQILNSETKKKLELKKAAIIFVDCDLYEAAVLVLDFITDYIDDGTIIIFDDWFCFRGSSQRGEQQAFAQWLVKNPDIIATEYQRFNWKGNSFILNKAGR